MYPSVGGILRGDAFQFAEEFNSLWGALGPADAVLEVLVLVVRHNRQGVDGEGMGLGEGCDRSPAAAKAPAENQP